MAVRLKKASSAARVKLGAAVLAASRGVDTRLVKERLQRFEEVHRNYTSAQKKVDAAEAQYLAVQAGLEKLDETLNETVEGLAVALVQEGQPRRNPFEAFGAPAPSGVTKLSFTEKTAVVRKLVATVVRSRNVTEATIKAAQAAEEAARALEHAMLPVAKLEENVRHARGLRDAVGIDWDTALNALRGVARVAAREGAPSLHAALFRAVSRAATKTKPPSETPSAGNTAPAEATKAA